MYKFVEIRKKNTKWIIMKNKKTQKNKTNDKDDDDVDWMTV